MTNEEFIKFIPLIKGAISRYKNCKIEYDDLYQIGSIAVVKMHDKYDPARGMTLNNFLFKCVLWAVNKELENMKNKDEAVNIFVNSIYEPIGEDLTIADTLEDINVNVEKQVTEKLILQDYYDEIIRCLDTKKSNVMILKAFYGMSYKDISETLTIPENRINNILMNGRMDLLRKSPFIKKEYLNSVNSRIDIYRNVEKTVIEREKSRSILYGI